MDERNEPLLPSIVGRFLLWFACLTGVYLVLAFLSDGDMLRFVNTTQPIVLLVFVLVWAGRLLHASPLLIWTPFPWFLLACAAYYGLGPLVHAYADQATLVYVDKFYALTDRELLRTNLLNVIGIGVTTLGYWAGIRLLPVRPDHSPLEPVSDVALRNIALLLLAIGFGVQLLFALPYALGQLNIVVPGIVLGMQTFSALAVVVLMVLVHRGRLRWRPVLWTVVGLELTVALLTLAKIRVLTVVIVLILGRVLVERRLRPIVIGTVSLVLIYVLLVPAISYGRAQLRLGGDQERFLGLGDRYSVMAQFFSSNETADLDDKSWWTRLDYAPAQAFAMTAHDSGRPGASLELAFYVLIPRVLWPDKPFITVGADFNQLVTGNPNSQSAPGVFAEAYWNAGWPMVALVALYAGGLFALFARYSMRHLLREELILLPVVFMGVQVGFKPDHWFVAAFIGGPAFAVIYHYLLRTAGLALTAAKRVRGAAESPLRSR